MPVDSLSNSFYAFLPFFQLPLFQLSASFSAFYLPHTTPTQGITCRLKWAMLHRWWYGFGAAAVVAGDRGYVLLHLLSSCIATYLDVGFTVWFAVLTTVWSLTGMTGPCGSRTCMHTHEKRMRGMLLLCMPSFPSKNSWSHVLDVCWKRLPLPTMHHAPCIQRLPCSTPLSLPTATKPQWLLHVWLQVAQASLPTRGWCGMRQGCK